MQPEPAGALPLLPIRKQTGRLLEARQGGSFVFGDVQDLVQMNHAKHHLDAGARRIEHTLPAVTFYGGKGVQQEADAGAVHIAHVREVYGQVGGAARRQLPDLVAEGIFRGAKSEGPLEVEDRDAACVADMDVQTVLSLASEATRKVLLYQ